MSKRLEQLSCFASVDVENASVRRGAREAHAEVQPLCGWYWTLEHPIQHRNSIDDGTRVHCDADEGDADGVPIRRVTRRLGYVEYRNCTETAHRAELKFKCEVSELLRVPRQFTRA